MHTLCTIMSDSYDYYCVALITKFNDSRWVEELVSIATMNVCSIVMHARFSRVSCKIPVVNLVFILARLVYDSCM